MTMPSDPIMIESILAVFLFSLTGSFHCAGMCGAFVAFAVSTPGADPARQPSRTLLHVAYNGGRLITYTILGAIAGAVGAALDLGGAQVGVARTAMLLAGSVMIGFGVVTFLRLRGVKLPSAPIPMAWRKLISRGHKYALGRPPVIRALVIGLLTTLLPCGWLYIFAVYAASTGSAPAGAITMAVFWVGTLPWLVAVGEGIGRLTGVFGRHLPTLTTAAIVLTGVWTIVGRSHAPAFAGERPHAITASDTANAPTPLQQLEAASQETPACCAEPEHAGADPDAH
ncbi:MAG: sulfite exporter TauE/SafE family protein [Phycisphaeraceae bacterium]|nr:sulfite exporter TauE/SafE family protein [Phycisphaeraceae bacterium]